MIRLNNLTAVAAAVALSVGLVACGGGGSSTTATPDPMPTPQETCEAADGRFNADGTCTSAADLAIERQHEAVSDAIGEAMAAVAALSGASTDAEVTAAEGLITAARSALDGASLLSANQVNALDNRLDNIDGDLVMAKSDITDHRQLMSDQRMAAGDAITRAMNAVNGLSAMSEDADVDAAKDAIQAAKDAVMAATALSMADRDSLTDRISMIETTLAGTETDIADQGLRTAVNDAIDAAMTVVGNLSNMSEDADVDAAKDAIQAAKDALEDATSVLTAEQALALNSRISTIEGTLGSTEEAIATYRDDAEDQRVKDVASARAAAMQFYMDADADATKAEAAATEAEMTAPGSQGATDAREAANAARTAADDAKKAHDAIMADMTKAEADAQADEAETQAGNANSSYMTAKMELDDIKTAATASGEQRRVADISAAKEAAGEAVTAAMTAKNDAETAATEAEEARDDAMRAYMRAIAARTNADDAEAEYEKAKAAAKAARAAATAANNAYMAAKMAAEGIMDDGTADDAKSAQRTAETEQGKAEAQQRTAETEQGKAEAAEAAAMTAAGDHVYGLLKVANAVGVEDDPETVANEQADAVQAIAEAISRAAGTTAAAGGTNDADNDSSTDAGTPSTSSASAMWPADTPDVPDTEADEFEAGMLSITVTRATGSELVFRTMAAEEDDAGTATVDETIVTAVKFDEGLPDFMHGYSISDRGTHAIVFTDKVQATPAADAKTVTVRNHAVSAGRITTNVDDDGDPVALAGTLSDLGTNTKYDHDGNPDTLPLVGTYSCAAGSNCVIEVTGTQVTGITGSVLFTSVPDTDGDGDGAPDNGQGIIAAAKAADMMDNYLTFGVWFDGDDSTGNDGSGDPQFAAFANGGNPFDAGATLAAVTGTATYEGSAAGVKATASSVDYFSAGATLTAKFGAIDTEAERTSSPPADTTVGTVTGRIHTIVVAGGEPLSHSIYLDESAIGTAGALSGRARKGDRVVGDDGNVTYPLNGRWSGTFYNPAQTAAGVDDLNKAPGSVAGTFGVTMPDDSETEDVNELTSFVGAFGAHIDE